MDSAVNEVARELDEPKKRPAYFKLAILGISIVVATATTVEYNKYSNKRVYEEGVVDFDARPTISTVHSGKDESGKQKIVPVKVVNFGEHEKEYDFLWRFKEQYTLGKLYAGQNLFAFDDVRYKLWQNTKMGKFHYPINMIEGRSTEVRKDKLPYDFSVCVVQSKQTGKLSRDGTYYLLSDAMPIYAKKDILDFAVKTHEAGHCYFRTYIGDKDEADPDLEYKSVLMEVSGDLAATLDYARVTGTLDMFTELWRPYRLASACVGDRVHQTAWALDVILKDKSIDLDALTRKGPEEIGPMVNYLMEKHFADPNGQFTPTNSPASQAVVANLKAQKLFDGDSPDDAAIKDRFKADIAQSMIDHRAKWASLAPDDAVALFDERLSALSQKFNIDINAHAPTSLAPHQDRLDSKRPMGVLEYLTGKDYPL